MDILTQLKRDEGVRLKPYRDSVGKLTIGTGRNLDDVGISLEENDLMLRNDIERSRRDLFQHLPWVVCLDDARRGVLLNLTFNMGIGGLCAFRNTLALIQQGQYDKAAEAMLQSKWAEQVGPRAHRLAVQMQTGQWQ
jgi:lysozyme